MFYPKNAYSTKVESLAMTFFDNLLNLELFRNCYTLYLYQSFEKNFKDIRKIKMMKFKGETGC